LEQHYLIHAQANLWILFFTVVIVLDFQSHKEGQLTTVAAAMTTTTMHSVTEGAYFHPRTRKKRKVRKNPRLQ
jgi:hypothetical protein